MFAHPRKAWFDRVPPQISQKSNHEDAVSSVVRPSGTTTTSQTIARSQVQQPANHLSTFGGRERGGESGWVGRLSTCPSVRPFACRALPSSFPSTLPEPSAPKPVPASLTNHNEYLKQSLYFSLYLKFSSNRIKHLIEQNTLSIARGCSALYGAWARAR